MSSCLVSLIRSCAFGFGPEDSSWYCPSGGGADDHLRPDQSWWQSQCAPRSSPQAQVELGFLYSEQYLRNGAWEFWSVCICLFSYNLLVFILHHSPYHHLSVCRSTHDPSQSLLVSLTRWLPCSPSLSHPSDEKEHSTSFPRNISAASLGSLITHHQSSSNHLSPVPEPSVTEPLMGSSRNSQDSSLHIDIEKNEVIGWKCIGWKCLYWVWQHIYIFSCIYLCVYCLLQKYV